MPNISQSPVIKQTRAELMHGDLTWFAIYLLKLCVDTPADEAHLSILMDEATQQLAHIRQTHRGRVRPRVRIAPVTSEQKSGT